MRNRILKCFGGLILVIMASLSFATPAFSDNNNVCKNGAPTKSSFLNCYNTNASARALFNSLGITAEGIEEASTTSICAHQGYMSYGRQSTPGSVAVNPDGQRFYRRPLSTVMRGCAAAWKIHTKDGFVWVLKFCANPETKKSPRVPPTPHHPSVKLKKLLEGGSYSGYFTFKVKLGAKSTTRKVKANVTTTLGTVRKGTKVSVCEINVPSGWQVKGSKCKVYTINRTRTLVFTNKKKGAPSKPPTDVDQTNKNATSGAGNCNSTNSGNLTGPGTVQGSCNQVNVNCHGSGSCSPSTTNHNTTNQSCVNNGGGNTNSDTRVCTNEHENCTAKGSFWYNNMCNQNPPCQKDCNPTPPSCTGLTVSKYGSTTGQYGTGLGVQTMVSYSSGDYVFNHARFNWGDGTSTTNNASTASHTYQRSGTYTITAIVNFTGYGDVTSQQCQRTITVTLTCPPGNTPNNDGSQCVKDGSSQDPPTAPGSPSNPQNPPSSGTGTQCKWINAGTYNGKHHNSGDDVSKEDIAHNGGAPPPGTKCQ